MMTHELEVSILTAPLAAMDRRALSQAWYSALHCTQRSQARVRTAASEASHGPVVRPQAARLTRAVSGFETAPAPWSAERRRDAHVSCDAARLDSASPLRGVSPLSRRIERRFAAAAQPVARATFSIGHGTARVHVIMQRNGNTARLVAICRPAMRDLVARALAEARMALRARGINVATAAREVRGCF